MEEAMTKNQRLLTRYLAAVGFETLEILSMIMDLWDEEAVLEMLEFCASHSNASKEQLLRASSEISSKIVSEDEEEE